jgi:hypothetical protein
MMMKKNEDDKEGLGKENLVQLKLLKNHVFICNSKQFHCISLFCIVCLSIVLNQVCVRLLCHCLSTIN